MPDAITPYNFVPQSDTILSAEEHLWTPAEAEKPADYRPYPRAERYHENLRTGWFDLELTALTPIFTRDVKKPEDCDPKYPEKQPVEFFCRPDGTFALPGSGLRGMIRSVFEIMTRSDMEFISRQQLFYRSFAETRNTNLRTLYSARFDKSLLCAGLIEEQNGQLKLRVSTRSAHGFVVIRASKLPREWWERGRGQFKSPRPVRVEIASATHPMLGVSIADEADPSGADWLIVPGMDVPRRDGTQRTWFQVILKPVEGEEEIFEIPADIYRDYLAWGDTAHGSRFGDPKENAPRKLESNKPAFALLDKNRKVTAIGANMMMALRYENSIKKVAERAMKPPTPDVDMTQALFGRVRDSKQNEQTDQIRGRIFFEDAISTSAGDPHLHIKQTDRALLLGPKPTSFQIYLQQPNPNSLVHWDNAKAILAGRKFYWHRSADAAESALTLGSGGRQDLAAELRPLKAGTQFKGRVRFENLTDAEIGALYAAIHLPDGLAHKFGMGKSLGLGSLQVKVKSVEFLDMSQRFASLAAGAGHKTSDQILPLLTTAYSAFVNRVSPGADSLWKSDHMKTLAAMLTWVGRPPDRLTEQVGFSDQWKYRWTLPSPRDLATLQMVTDVLPVTVSVSPLSARATSDTPSDSLDPAPTMSDRRPDKPQRSALVKAPPGRVYREGEKLTCRVTARKSASEVEVELPDGSRSVAEQVYFAALEEVIRLKVMKIGGDGKVKRLRPS